MDEDRDDRLVTLRLYRDGVLLSQTNCLFVVGLGFQAVTPYQATDGAYYEARVEIQGKRADRALRAYVEEET